MTTTSLLLSSQSLKSETIQILSVSASLLKSYKKEISYDFIVKASVNSVEIGSINLKLTTSDSSSSSTGGDGRSNGFLSIPDEYYNHDINLTVDNSEHGIYQVLLQPHHPVVVAIPYSINEPILLNIQYITGKDIITGTFHSSALYNAPVIDSSMNSNGSNNIITSGRRSTTPATIPGSYDGASVLLSSNNITIPTNHRALLYVEEVVEHKEPTSNIKIIGGIVIAEQIDLEGNRMKDAPLLNYHEGFYKEVNALLNRTASSKSNNNTNASSSQDNSSRRNQSLPSFGSYIVCNSIDETAISIAGDDDVSQSIDDNAIAMKSLMEMNLGLIEIHRAVLNNRPLCLRVNMIDLRYEWKDDSLKDDDDTNDHSSISTGKYLQKALLAYTGHLKESSRQDMTTSEATVVVAAVGEGGGGGNGIEQHRVILITLEGTLQRPAGIVADTSMIDSIDMIIKREESGVATPIESIMPEQQQQQQQQHSVYVKLQVSVVASHKTPPAASTDKAFIDDHQMLIDQKSTLGDEVTESDDSSDMNKGVDMSVIAQVAAEAMIDDNSTVVPSYYDDGANKLEVNKDADKDCGIVHEVDDHVTVNIDYGPSVDADLLQSNDNDHSVEKVEIDTGVKILSDIDATSLHATPSSASSAPSVLSSSSPPKIVSVPPVVISSKEDSNGKKVPLMNQHDFFVSGTATAGHNRINDIIDSVDGFSVDRQQDDELVSNSQLNNPTKKLNTIQLHDLLNHRDPHDDDKISILPINHSISTSVVEAPASVSQFELKKNETTDISNNNNNNIKDQHSMGRSNPVTAITHAPPYLSSSDTELVTRLRQELINKQSIINQLKEDMDVRNEAIQVCGKDIRSLREEKVRLQQMMEGMELQKETEKEEKLKVSKITSEVLKTSKALHTMNASELMEIINKLRVDFQDQEAEKMAMQNTLKQTKGYLEKYAVLKKEHRSLQEAHLEQSKHLQKMNGKASQIQLFEKTIKTQEKVIFKLQNVLESNLKSSGNSIIRGDNAAHKQPIIPTSSIPRSIPISSLSSASSRSIGKYNNNKDDDDDDDQHANMPHPPDTNEPYVKPLLVDEASIDVDTKQPPSDESEEIVALKNEVLSLKSDISSLESEISYLQETVKDLEEQVEEHAREINEKGSDDDDNGEESTEEIRLANRKIDQLEAENTSQSYKVSALENQLKTSTQEFSKEIARLKTIIFEYEMENMTVSSEKVDTKALFDDEDIDTKTQSNSRTMSNNTQTKSSKELSDWKARDSAKQSPPNKNESTATKNESSATKNESSAAKNESTATKNESTATKNESSPHENESPPNKNESTATKNESSATKNESSATKNESSPHENESPPNKNESTATKNESSATKNESSAAKNESTATKNESSPHENESPPHENESPPTKNESSPTKNESSPTKNESSPTKNESSPIKNESSPTKYESSPNEYEPSHIVESPSSDETMLGYRNDESMKLSNDGNTTGKWASKSSNGDTLLSSEGIKPGDSKQDNGHRESGNDNSISIDSASNDDHDDDGVTQAAANPNVIQATIDIAKADFEVDSTDNKAAIQEQVVNIENSMNKLVSSRPSSAAGSGLSAVRSKTIDERL